MNKYSNSNAKFPQKNTKTLTEIGLYNLEVNKFLCKNPISFIIQAAIKNFNDSAQRRKLTQSQYNREVEEFNDNYGFYILKKGNEVQQASKYYSYINYPFLNSSAIKNTMDNYRLYVHNYNKKAEKENETIAEYNNTIVKQHLNLTEAQLKRKKNFHTQNNRLFSRDYNLLVEKENENDPIIPKKKIQTIKYATELFFETLVGFYTSQLKSLNAYKMEMNISTSIPKTAITKLKIDHRKLVTHKLQGVKRIAADKRTAQNHIKRLREANLLVNYERTNHKTPIKVNFNPEIIVILDGNSPKPQNTEKQYFKNELTKVLHDNTDTTRTFLKEKERKDCAKSTSLNKCGSMLEENESNDVCLADSYKNTKEINKKISLEGGEKISLPNFLTERQQPTRRTNQLTDNFLRKLINQSAFAEKLAAGEFDNYKGLRYDYLLKIEQYALASNEEFKQIIIQDFIKSSAKIWRNHNVFVGEWKKTINQLNEELFANITQKETIINKLREYRWKLNFAKKWFDKNKEVNALFPYKYFDRTRIKSNELGFYGLHSVWKSHLKYLEKRRAEKINQQAESNARKRKLTAQKKLTFAINKYESGKYNEQQLFNYVQNNLPNDYLILLTNLLKNNSTNLA